MHMCFIDTGYTEIATHIEVQYFGKYGVRIFENRFVQFNAAEQRRDVGLLGMRLTMCDS